VTDFELLGLLAGFCMGFGVGVVVAVFFIR